MKSMKTLFMLSALLLTAYGIRAQEWVDVTSRFIDNPDFSGNSRKGWTFTSNANSTDINFNCQEFWDGTFDFHKTLTSLPAGHYRLRVNAFYRAGSNAATYPLHENGEESVTAVLYAGDAETTVHSVFDWYFGNATSGTVVMDSKPYPNNMFSAYVAFSYGAYENVLEFDTDDGSVDIGLRNDNYVHDNWCIFTHFVLEYQGEVESEIQVTDIKVTATATSLKPGETAKAKVTYTPDNATRQEVSWSSDNILVATVDQEGNIIARTPGSAHITATTVDGSDLSQSITIIVNKVSDTDTRTWTDVTSIYLQNPGFDDNNTLGWDVSYYGGAHNVRMQSAEFWNTSSFSLTQTVNNLPRGIYRLSANAFHRYSGCDASVTAYSENIPDVNARIVALSGDQTLAESPVKSYFSEWVDDFFIDYDTQYNYGSHWYKFDDEHFFPNTMESAGECFANGMYRVKIEFDAQGDVTLGFLNDTYVRENWFICDDVKLEYLGDVLPISSVSMAFESTGTTAVTMKPGDTDRLFYTLQPEGTLAQSTSWNSDNTAVATVASNGTVTAVGSGEATITLTVFSISGQSFQATATVTVERDQLDANAIIINEVMAANVDEFISPAYNFDGWIELYNPTSKAANLVGLYVSDDPADLTKWKMPVSMGTLPARGYRVIWFDSNDICATNCPFSLDVDGGVVIISDADGTVIVEQSYPAAIRRTTYARTTDGGNSWSTAVEATPGASNNGAAYATGQVEAPVVDKPSQLFTTSISFSVTIPAGSTLRYTLDGTLPTLTNGSTSANGLFTFESNANIRLRLFADGKLPSDVVTRSFIRRNYDFNLPVLSVVTDDSFLYGTEYGVFVKGPNGRPGNGQSDNCNFNMNWQRPVNFSLINVDGSEGFSQDVNLEVCGGWSRAWYPRAFKLKGNKKLSGNKNLFYPFFDEKPYIRNRTLQVRNGGNDTNCRFKDPALQYLVQTAGINIDLQSYQPVHEYLNGEYIGVLNIREPNNKHYVYANYGWDDDEIDQFEMSPDSGYVQKCGTKDAFNQLIDLSYNAQSEDAYNEICRLLDIDAYANYMAVELYLDNWDWPQNNVKGFRHQQDGKFRFVLFDLDGTFNNGDPFSKFMQKEYYTFDQLYPTELGRRQDYIRFVTLFKNLLKNDTFRQKFVDAYSIMGGSVFEKNRATEICAMLYNRVEPEMNLIGNSAWNTYSSLRNNLGNRLNNATYYLRWSENFNLSDTEPKKVELSSDTEGSQLFINDMAVPTGYFNGRLFAPCTLRAQAPAGYEFQGWKQSGGSKLIDTESNWYYYDQGSLDGINWTRGSGNVQWWSGTAPFGARQSNFNTVIDYYGRYNGGEKHPTVYFFKYATIDFTPKSSDVFRLNYTVDDGFIVYVNGKEAGRYNMPEGDVTYDTYALDVAYGNPDSGTLDIPASFFQPGSNAIAVEIHDCSASSTDLYWEASLTVERSGAPDIVSTEQVISLPEGNSMSLVASYRRLSDEEMAEQGINPVRINEVSGSNNVYINEYSKKNDWIELVNTTDSPVDVEGMFLSDNVDKPEKYMISKGATNAVTVIEPHGHLLVWCDKLQTTDRALHASFKIDGDGGYVILTAADGSWKDVLSYGPHDGNSSVGRYPDGANEVYAMTTPTIGKANLLTSYATVEEQVEPEPDGIVTNMASNGVRISYGRNTVFVRSDAVGTTAILDIFEPDGRLVERRAVGIDKTISAFSVENLPSGFYIARVAIDDNTRVACKFAK